MNLDLAHMALQADSLPLMVSTAVAPALLLGAVVAQLRVLNNRLTRIVDRYRFVANQEILPSDLKRVTEARHELAVLNRRRYVIHRAIVLSCLCALLVCAAVASLFLHQILQERLAGLVAVFFITAMACMAASYLLFLDEIFLSIRKIKLTIRGSRHLPH